MKNWLHVQRGAAPVVLSLPHTGTSIPAEMEALMVSPWLARKDADWWVDDLYDFARGLDITTVRTAVSRTVIDVNRDPSGQSLYPGQNTTGLCPLTTFDDEPLYLPGLKPDDADIASRREAYFDPYHAALAAEIERLGAVHPRVVLYDAHSIRSHVPRLFEGELPQFNVGTNDGESCDVELTDAIAALCAASGRSHVVNGRFKGGWITRHYGEPARGVHAVQMELACRGYLAEPEAPITSDNWPAPLDPARAAPLRDTLKAILETCIAFAVRTDE
ncbi:MAG TPA: N-formylglutamate deformylase [Steroidobacteraceae bacterium]|nr:N-formylglutamate deformylase [Steroidobacteraceae bacterium]